MSKNTFALLSLVFVGMFIGSLNLVGASSLNEMPSSRKASLAAIESVSVDALSNRNRSPLPFERISAPEISPTTTFTVTLPLVLAPEYASWTRIGDMPNSVEKFYDVAVCENGANSRSIAGTTDGVYLLDNQGTWTKESGVFIDGTVLDVSVVPDGYCNKFYAAVLNKGLAYGEFPDSAQEGSWTQVFFIQGGKSIRTVEIRTHDQEEAYDVYIGGEFGIQWAEQPKTTDTVWHQTNRSDIFVTGFFTDKPKDPSTVYAASWGDEVYYNDPQSNDNKLWSADSAPEEEQRLYQVARGAGGSIAATLTGTYFQPDGASDAEWQIATGIPKNRSYTVTASDWAVYTGEVNSPVFVSYDKGANWQKIDNGMCFEDCMDGGEFQTWSLTIESNGVLYAATTTGIWQWSEVP